MDPADSDRPKPDNVFSQLMTVIESRRDNPPERSYTTSLFQAGTGKIGRKIIEEAAEVVEAATEFDEARGHESQLDAADVEKAREHLIYEAGDVIYHLFVLLGHHHIGLDDVAAELARRFGTSGLDEKASRANNPPQ